MNKVLLSFILLNAFNNCHSQQKPGTIIYAGEEWPASDGKHINAHGGGIIKYNGICYWFGGSRLARTDENSTTGGIYMAACGMGERSPGHKAAFLMERWKV